MKFPGHPIDAETNKKVGLKRVCFCEALAKVIVSWFVVLGHGLVFLIPQPAFR